MGFLENLVRKIGCSAPRTSAKVITNAYLARLKNVGDHILALRYALSSRYRHLTNEQVSGVVSEQGNCLVNLVSFIIRAEVEQVQGRADICCIGICCIGHNLSMR